jgi:hypothetical protein
MVLKKTCTKCKKSLDVFKFHNCKRYVDGKVSRCKKCVGEYSKKHYSLNIDKHKTYNEVNSESRNEYHSAYRINNRERFSAVKRFRRRTDPEFKLMSNLRTRIWSALNYVGKKKNCRTIELIGCTIDFLKDYLAARFQSGMTWDNYGDWHIDHILPCASFDLTIIEQQNICFNYKNLQPLWAVDNLKKGDRIIKLNSDNHDILIRKQYARPEAQAVATTAG